MERFLGRNSNFAIAIHSSSFNAKDAKTKLEIVYATLKNQNRLGKQNQFYLQQLQGPVLQ